jgi:hypothetical protein
MLQAITRRLKPFKRNRRGISTVIVVMLSLVLIVIIVGNVFLWSYQMNQIDWEKMQEKVDIVNAQFVNDTWAQNPTAYALRGSTSWVSGDILDLAADDDVYMTFRSYSSGTASSYFVDNDLSNVDSSSDKGTQSNFTAQQYGPDSIYDTLTEENTAAASNVTLINAESFEGPWPPTGWSETGAWNRENNQAYAGIYSADFDGGSGLAGVLTTPDLDTSDSTAIYVDFWYRDDGSEPGEFVLQYYDGFSWDTVSDLGATLLEGQWLHYQETVTDSQYFKSDFRIRWSTNTNYYNDVVYVDLVTVTKETGQTNYELDLEAQWTNVDYTQANEELSIYVNTGSNSHSLDATGGYMLIGDGTPDWGSTTGTISFWIQWDTVANRPWGQHDNMEARFSGTNLVLDWGGTSALTSSTSFTAGRWYFIAIVWNQYTDDLYLYVGDQDNPPSLDAYNNAWTGTVSTLGVTQNNFMASRGGLNPTDGHGDDLRYWDIDRSLAEIQSDYNVELSGSETNLRSYFKLNNNFDDAGPDNNDGSGVSGYSFSSDVPFGLSSTENLRVDVWTGAAWQNIFTDLTNGWNNVSVSSYLTSSTFTIRFKGSAETSDSIQDSWNIDVALLRAWIDEYTTEVEFTGLSNVEEWTQLEWATNVGWTTGSVNVALQLYNFTLDGYPTSGNGYMTYTSDSSPNVDETISQTISTNPTDFRNATGYWKMKIKGTKTGTTQFDLNADWIEIREARLGTLVTFENRGSLTSHIVSLWVNNSTSHERYRMNFFIAPGETTSYFNNNIVLPAGTYMLKVSTERGNTAVFSEG